MAQTNTKTSTRSSVKVDYPKRHNVILHNDEFTPMEFVIHLLIEVFNKNIEQAKEITMSVHTDGRAVAATYSYEVAEQKTHEAILITRHSGHPLQITHEPV